MIQNPSKSMKIHQNHIKIIFFIPIRAPTRRPRWVRDPCTLHEREKGSLKLFRVFSHPSPYTHHGNKKPYPFYRSFFSRNDAGNYVVILLLSGRGIRMSRGVREQTDAPQVSKRYSYRGGGCSEDQYYRTFSAQFFDGNANLQWVRFFIAVLGRAN